MLVCSDTRHHVVYELLVSGYVDKAQVLGVSKTQIDGQSAGFFLG